MNPPTTCPFEFHKVRYRDTRCSADERIECGRWLLGNGVQFDQGKFILPNGELPR